MSEAPIIVPKARKQDELQQAHDMLASIVLGWRRYGSFFPVGMGAVLVAQLEVLCWALNHNHNTRFAEKLAQIDRTMTERGVRLYESPQFFTDKEQS